MIRFIMFGTGRSGSTVVANALADHPQVLFYGELFHFDAKRRREDAARTTLGAGVVRRLPHGIAPCQDAEDGAAYAERLYSQAPAGFRAAGFKLFHGHAQSGANASVWSYLAALPALRILHVSREDWLAALVSRERAERSRLWHAEKAPAAAKPFRLEPEACLRFFERRVQGAARAAPLLDGHSVLQLEYAEIAAGFAACMARVWAFLGVDALPDCAPRTAKIARLAPRDEILNYDELRERFRSTPYARFFP